MSTAQLLALCSGDEVNAEFEVGRGEEGGGGVAQEAAVASLSGFLEQYVRQKGFHHGAHRIQGGFGGAAAGIVCILVKV